MIRFFFFLFMSSVILSSCAKSTERAAEDAFRKYNGNHVIIISKKKFTLYVFEKGKGLQQSYRIGFGSNSDLGAKQYEGDNRTPEGSYQVNEILSMDSASASESYRKLKKMNEHYFKKSGGYHKFGNPDEDLGDNAYGPRYFGVNYPNEDDLKRYQEAVSQGLIPVKNGKRADIGHGIAIHGNNDEKSIGHPCSSGCIRMYNRDIVELEKYISISTPVIILND